MKDCVSYVGGKTVDVHYVSYNVSYDGYKITVIINYKNISNTFLYCWYYNFLHWYEIQKYLETSCDANKANIIVIIGESEITTDIETVSMISRMVSSTNIDKTLTPAILELETKLQAVLPR